MWWMIPRVGDSGSDIPIETQMLLLEVREAPGFGASNETTSYIIFLPVLDGEFRSSLQGNSSNELQFCVESGKSLKLCLSLSFCFFLFMTSVIL
jgi:hypothetical protein